MIWDDDDEMEMTHATRPDYLAAVMPDGAKTTGMSHGVVGLWCRRMDCAEKDAHNWGRTPLDFFSGCFITLKASTENLEIDAEDIGGDGERVAGRAGGAVGDEWAAGGEAAAVGARAVAHAQVARGHSRRARI